jgi:anti-sigma B factor antagonist
MDQLVSVAVQQLPELSAVLVRVDGELDFATSRRLSEALSGLPSGSNLIFDLSELRFCDSSGLGVLIAAHKSASAAGARPVLVGLTPTVQTAIRVTMLDQLFSVRETVEAAMAELSTSTASGE